MQSRELSSRFRSRVHHRAARHRSTRLRIRSGMSDVGGWFLTCSPIGTIECTISAQSVSAPSKHRTSSNQASKPHTSIPMVRCPTVLTTVLILIHQFLRSERARLLHMLPWGISGPHRAGRAERVWTSSQCWIRWCIDQAFA